VNEKTVCWNYEFARTVDRVKAVKPKAIEKVLRGKVKDVITALSQLVKRKKAEG